VPISLATLFCAPADVWDILSAEGVDLRLDDHNLASGQIIATTADTPVGATSMTVSAIPVALLAGAQLVFDSAGMAAPVQVQLSAVANVGATSLSLQATTIDVPSGAQARDSGVNAATGARLVTGCRKGTSKIKLYCNQRYDDGQLKLSGTVLDWAALYAAKWLCSRRAQGVPKSIAADWEDAKEELLMVQMGQLSIEDCATRGTDWPSISNITVDPGYDFMRARVEPNISEQTPTAYSQFIDWNSAAWLEW